MKGDHDMSIIIVQQSPGRKNCIGVSFPELELIPYIFDEVDPTHFKFPISPQNFLVRNRMLRIFENPLANMFLVNLSFKIHCVQYSSRNVQD